LITKDNFGQVLEKLGFIESKEIYTKKLIYPEVNGLRVNNKTTSNFTSPENFVVFECVDRLLSQGYYPKHIEIEKEYPLGHTGKSGRADIVVNDNNNTLLIIECKTAGVEYKRAIDILNNDANNQLFSYLQQATSTKFLALYESNFLDDKVIANYYLINVNDNDELLANDEKLKSYKDATDVKEKYQVWCDTYDKNYATIGIFEDNKPYEIGKTKFNINDLHTISSQDIQGKYHEFATILRKHNVSGRENAFDKLVNLFLCKVTDEKENPNELKFYYKGKAYDDPFSFQDRLQQLYKVGMDKFLDDEITYVATSEIDEAFNMFKKNATKDEVKKLIKKLKFFTNNDFAFIDVHNEPLFKKNFQVLLEISKIIQDIKLTGSEENQFLGDMFESFLDQGVKQSEGQFFTPMPLVKFIISSLPKKDNSNVIDYACGSGHFLNEYALINPSSKIVGIEKEYRLSKVAKVSSFMYGSDIDIVYSDALSKNKNIKNNSFDVLIANPPYSVKGFLSTLSREDREAYELIDAVDSKSYSKTGAIECFFIEKAKQLLTKGAVAGIIVPSSILNKDTPKLYTRTREVILKYFDIVAIAEFGSGTFGKTGTNTVTLFLKKRGSTPNISTHFENMIDSWFECDMKTNEAFKQSDILEKYCSYIDIDFEIYKTLLCQDIDDKLFENETFKEYKNSFDKKELKKIKFKKGSTKEEKELKIKQLLTSYIIKIEKNKLLYFALASTQINDIVIVKSPTSNSEMKKFLGYEWGGRKGSEGIKYFTKADIQVDDDIDEDDIRVLENLQSLKNIDTPLYNPNNNDDETKINKIIKDNFENIKTDIPKELDKYVSRARLVDMLDFSRIEFNKSIDTSNTKKLILKSKYKLEKLGEICIVKDGTHESPKFHDTGYPLITSKNLTSGQLTFNDIKFISKQDFISINQRSKVDIGDILFAMIGTVGNPVIVDTEKEFAIKNVALFKEVKNTKLLNKYLKEILEYKIVKEQLDLEQKGSNRTFVSLSILRNLKIPLPPLDIQKQIVKECQKVDDEVLEANNEIEKIQNEIEEAFIKLSQQSTQTFRLSDESMFELFIGKRVLAKDISQDTTDGIPVYSANVFEVFGYINKELIKDFSKDSVLWGIDGDWMVNYKKVNEPFYPTDHCGVIRIKNDKLHPRYLTWALEKVGSEKRFSRANRASTASVKALSIKAPDIKEQIKLAKKIEKLEIKLDEDRKVIDVAKVLKENILRKYLC